MYIARLICSDPACTERIVSEAETLAELETLACECGCGFDVVGIPDWIEEDGVVVALRRRRPSVSPPLPHAA